MPENLTKIFYIEDSGSIIGTISIDKEVIKCFAVDGDYQSSEVSSLLINETISYFKDNNIYNYQVYTKPKYKKQFISFGFRELVETNNVALLEAGAISIFDSIKKIKTEIDISVGEIDETSDIASIVMNANPITLGHEYLIEKASREHNIVLVFVVEEDLSYFSFKERQSMVYLTCHKYDNVIVIPSTKYMVSLMSFPSYFLKTKEEVVNEYALIDSLIFKEYFMKYLFIKKRYVGTETKDYMITYNEKLKEILKDDLIIVERNKNENNEIISASKIREYLKNKDINNVLLNVPREAALIIITKCGHE